MNHQVGVLWRGVREIFLAEGGAYASQRRNLVPRDAVERKVLGHADISSGEARSGAIRGPSEYQTFVKANFCHDGQAASARGHRLLIDANQWSALQFQVPSKKFRKVP